MSEVKNREVSPKPVPASANGTRQPPFDLFRTWKEYERVAMHFNNLLIRLRTQSLGAVAAFATLAGVALRGDVPVQVRWGTLAATFFLLAFFWLAIWILDFAYYNRLLLGAVKELIAIEKASSDGVGLKQITLSTGIQNALENSESWRSMSYWRSSIGRWLFYSIVFCVLLLGLGESINKAGGLTSILAIR
jgi:hypothetical protein